MDFTIFLLTVVRKRPGMYLTDNKLISLKKFETGYLMALQNNSLAGQDKFFEFFSDWFISKMNVKAHAMWYPLILDECNRSEEKALEKFWEYLEEFDRQVPTTQRP